MEKDKGRKYKDSYIIKRLMKYASGYKWYFIIGFILTIFLVFVDLIPSYILGDLVGILSGTDSNEVKWNLVLFYVISFIVVIIITVFINYICAMTLQKGGQKVVYQIRKDVFEHVETLSIAQINAEPVGRFVTRVTNDTNALNTLYTDVLVNMFRYILTLIGVFSVMMVLNYKLTLYICTLIPILIIVTVLFKKISRKVYREVRGNLSDMNSFLSENLSGIKITQIFNQEDKKKNEFEIKNNNYKKSSLKEILVFGVFRPFIYVIYVSCDILVLAIGSAMVVYEGLPISTLVKIYSYTGKFFNPIQQIADKFNQLQSSLAASERIFELLDKKIEVLDNAGAIDLDHIKGDIEFKNVWFAYNDENWILRDVSFHIKAGETAAFVGATGAGKTTILALIVKNYKIQKGQILIDGIDIYDIKTESLRLHIGQMLQDVFLFTGTIKSNIKLNDDSISDEEVIEACKYVNANSFIDKLDGKYDYKVLERGNNFSTGQRQLLSFARTIIRKPNVMILDEATANIDTETECLIQDSLEKMMNIGTMLIVAHRLSTVQYADIIIVLHKGEVKEIGNHQELLHQHGLYYNLYELQYKK